MAHYNTYIFRALLLITSVAAFQSAGEVRSLLEPLLSSNVDRNARDYYLGYKPADYNTAWGKYYNATNVTFDAGFVAGLAQSPVPAANGTLFSNAAKALNQPGYLPLENGYTTLSDGSVELAILSDVPSKFTGEMFDFWFSWHTNDTTKYKLWNPAQHQYASSNTRDIKSETPSKSYRERYYNFTSFVDEYIGSTAYKLSITFFDPALAGFSADNDATGVETLVMAYVELFHYSDQNANAKAPYGLQPTSIVLAHQVRQKPDGTGKEIRSRFWIGQLLVAGMDLLMPPYQLAHDLSVHCAREMTHIGSYLPALFEEFRDDIPTVGSSP